MILTNDFVFIHFPKNAGSFVTECLYELYDGTTDKSRKKSFSDNWKGLVSKEHTNYSRKYISEALEYTGGMLKTQHQGCDEIPEAHRHKPIVSVLRNPFDRYASLYKYEWWKRYPILSEERLKELFPHFPDLSFEEYLDLSFNHNLKEIRAKNGIKVDIGFYSLYYIKMFAKNYLSVLKSSNNIQDFIDADYHEVFFLNQETLRDDLYEYLKKYNWADERLESIFKHEKVNTSRNDYSYQHLYTDKTKKMIEEKEEFLFTLFPEYSF